MKKETQKRVESVNELYTQSSRTYDRITGDYIVNTYISRMCVSALNKHFTISDVVAVKNDMEYATRQRHQFIALCQWQMFKTAEKLI